MPHEHNMPEQEKSSCMSSLQPWIVVVSATSFFFFIFVQMNIFNAISPYMIKDLGFTTSQLGMLSACYFYANTLLVFPAGILLDRISVKKSLMCSLAVASAVTYVFSIASDFYVMAICRFLLGVVGSFCFVSCVKLATRWFPPTKMALVVGVIVTIAMIGGMVAQAPMTMVVDSFGWRHGLLSNVFLGMVFFFLVAILVHDYPKGLKEKLLQQKDAAPAVSMLASLKKTVLNIQNWYSGIYISALNLPTFVIGTTWGSMYLMQAQNLTRAQSSVVISAMYIGLIIGSPLAGLVSDKLGRRKMPMIVGAILSFLVILTIIYVPNLSATAFTALFCLFGIVSSAQVIGYPLITESNTPEVAATATGIGSTLILAGGMLIPSFGWLMGLNWNHTMVDGLPVYSQSDYRLAMMMLVAAYVVSLIVSILAKETHCEQRQH